MGASGALPLQTSTLTRSGVSAQTKVGRVLRLLKVGFELSPGSRSDGTARAGVLA